MIDFEHGALRIEQSDELHHGVERDARDFLAIAFATVTRQQLSASHADQRG